MSKIKAFIYLFLLIFTFNQLYGSDVKIPIKQETINEFLKSLKPALAEKFEEVLKDEGQGWACKRGTGCYYVTVDLLSANCVEFRSKFNSKSYIDWGIFGKSNYTIYCKVKTKINFEMIYNSTKNRLEPNITSITDNHVDIWTSSDLIDVVAIFCPFVKVIEYMISKQLPNGQSHYDIIVNKYLPGLTIDLPKGSKLNFSEMTYSSSQDAFYVGLNYTKLQPIEVSISGPSSVHVPDKGMGSNSYTWTANVTNSTSPTYKWYKKICGTYYLMGSQRSYTETYSYEGYQSTSTFYLKVEVNDTDNRFASATKSVTMYHDASGGGGHGPLPKCPSQDQPIIPDELVLQNNYPNPFNPSTIISFGLPEDQHVKVVIYSLIGKKVITLVDDFLGKGFHDVQWDGRNQVNQNVSSGTYFYVLKTKKNRIVKKMFLLK